MDDIPGTGPGILAGMASEWTSASEPGLTCELVKRMKAHILKA